MRLQTADHHVTAVQDHIAAGQVRAGDAQAFPGRRALSAYPQEMMEIALLGDGAARDKLYPLDAKRAFAALNRIKPNIGVWWSSGAQSAQLIKDGEVDLMSMMLSMR